MHNNQMPGMQNQNSGMQTNQMAQNWDDQRMINDLLSTEKHMAGEYGTLITEGSTQQFRDLLTHNMQTTLQDQFEVFTQMSNRGWYPTKPAQQPEIQTAKQKFAAMRNELA